MTAFLFLRLRILVTVLPSSRASASGGAPLAAPATKTPVAPECGKEALEEATPSSSVTGSEGETTARAEGTVEPTAVITTCSPHVPEVPPLPAALLSLKRPVGPVKETSVAHSSGAATSGELVAAIADAEGLLGQVCAAFRSVGSLAASNCQKTGALEEEVARLREGLDAQRRENERLTGLTTGALSAEEAANIQRELESAALACRDA